MVSFLQGYTTPIGLFDTDNQFYTPIRGVLDFVDDVRGIAKTDFGYVLGVPNTGPYLKYVPQSDVVVLDKNFKKVSHLPTKNLSEVHSIIYKDKSLYAVSSGRDQVYQLDFDSSFNQVKETPKWSIRQSIECDVIQNTHHINSVGLLGDSLIVSMFGEKKTDILFGRRDGKVVECDTSTLLLDGLSHPHSIYVDGNDIILLESYLGNLIINGERKLTLKDTYVRGLALDAMNFYIGTSIRRTASKSNDGPNLTYLVSDKCGIFIVDRKTFEVKKFFDLSSHGKEIYDIVIVT